MEDFGGVRGERPRRSGARPAEGVARFVFAIARQPPYLCSSLSYDTARVVPPPFDTMESEAMQAKRWWTWAAPSCGRRRPTGRNFTGEKKGKREVEQERVAH